MATYLYLWEVDINKAPADPKERGAAWSMLLDLVTQDMEKGITKEWGSFVGESAGYFVAEGSEVEVALAIQQ